jgi:acetylornithine deacetylase
MQVADAHKSVAAYATIVHGHEAHSSKPSLGASAVEAACDLVTELYRFAGKLAASGMAEPRGIFSPSFAPSDGSFALSPMSQCRAKFCAAAP